MDNQHLARWQGLKSTQTQAQELISGPSPTAKTKLLSFNKTQSRVVTSLLTRQNTLRRHFHLMGLTNSPLCRRCREQDESSADVLCEFKSFGFAQICISGLLFSWNQRTLRLSKSGTSAKEQGSPETVTDYGAQRVCF